MDTIKITKPDGTIIEMPMNCLRDYLSATEGNATMPHIPTSGGRKEKYPDPILGAFNKDLPPAAVVRYDELRDAVRISSLQVALEDKFRFKITAGMITLYLNQNGIKVAFGKHNYRYIERTDLKLVRDITSRVDWLKMRELYIKKMNENG